MNIKEIGNYRIVREIGEGGMGIVYQATQTGLDRIVALKVLLSHLSSRERFVERFLREAKNAATLDHPSIVTIYEVGEQEGTYFFSMKYVEGEDLESELSRRSVPVERAVDIIRQVADGLAHAHEKGIIHRDIKPANIIVDKDGRAFITDFGIARAAWEERMTDAGMSVGTVEYMSPEQFRGEEPGPESDIYALGATFYHLLTGSSPFPGKTTQEVMYQKFEGTPPPPSRVNRSLPEWTDTVVEAAMHEDRGKRLRTAREFIEALDRREAPSMSAAVFVPQEAPGAAPVDNDKIDEREAKKANETSAEIVAGAPEPSRMSRRMIIGILGACIALGLVITMLFVVKAFTDRTRPVPGMIPESGGSSPVVTPPPVVETPVVEAPAPAPPPSSPVPAPAPEPSIRYGRITGDSVNIRSGPGVNYDKLTQLDSGDSVTILDETLAGSTSEGKLWSEKTVSLENGGGVALGEGYAVTVVGENGGNYRIRFDMDGAEYYGYVSKSSVKLFIDDYWYQVETQSGIIGWVIDDYVSVY